ncbi:hypothetical protein BVX97_04230 [bacterium E08(2017)]|nr:hypothetical protein BVX97_04230 [bacterium E08(2017)]
MSSSSLTVTIPVYNAMPFLKDAVESILNQTYSDFKLLLINDGSTDESLKYLETVDDPRVTLINNENQGLGKTLNQVIETCDTELLARMDADDISCPTRFEEQVRYMSNNPDIVMLGTQVEFFAENKTFPGPVAPTEHDDIYSMLLQGNVAVCHASCMFRTEALRSTGGYIIGRAGQDTDLFLRMCETGKTANLKNMLYRIRVHGSSTCFTDWDKINRGRAFAVDCAQKRQSNQPENDYDAFLEHWNKRPVITKLKDAIDVWSAVQYRNSMMDMANSRNIRGAIRLGLAAICRPGGVIRRLTGKRNIK